MEQRGKEYATDEDTLKTFRHAAAMLGIEPSKVVDQLIAVKVARMFNSKEIPYDSVLDCINYLVYKIVLMEMTTDRVMSHQSTGSEKLSFEKLLLENGWTIYLRDGEDSFPFLTDLGEREYWPDLMAWKDGYGWVVFEVDGRKGHWTRRDTIKMRLRDTEFAERDIWTVRIKTQDLTGRKRQPDSVNLQEIDYQMAMATGDKLIAVE